jgi:hypothetical protein
MKIYQIFYNQETKEMLDPQFIPFDNSSPSDKTWYEFEVIKKILQTGIFDDNEYIGIFSPRFLEKTGLSGYDVIEVLEKSKSEVINFSTNLEASILHLNCFSQAERHHPGFKSTAQKAYKIIGLDLDLSSLISNNSRTIFSNYFVAKYSFWKVWFKYALKLYFLSSNKSNLLYNKLNCLTRYKGGEVSMKVFIMERLVNVLLENKKVDSEIGANYEKYYSLKGYSSEIIKEMFIIDELKSLMKKNSSKSLLSLFFEKVAVYRYLKDTKINRYTL